MIRVRVPATSANLGAGFDCLGLALSMYNWIEVEETERGVEVIVPEADRLLVDGDDNNLVYTTMRKVVERIGYPIKGLRIKQVNDIPITRGLGSSAACIVGGILAANRLSGNTLSLKDMISLATEMDGHPDNVLPAFVGGLTVACTDGKNVRYARSEPAPGLKFAVMIPDFPLPTSMARQILPSQVSMGDAVYNIGRASLMFASLISGQVENLWTASDDRLHQPFRKKLIPHWDDIMDGAKNLGAKGVFLSGAGPTMIAILDGDYQIFQHEMSYLCSSFDEKWDIRIVDICTEGARIE